MKVQTSSLPPILLLLSALLYASAAHCGYRDYTLDSRANIVTGNGYEWLQWDETRGMSISDATRSYSSDGWRVASNSEMAFLFNDFGLRRYDYWTGESDDFDSDENTGQSMFEPADVIHNYFIDLFGATGVTYTDNFPELQIALHSSALFGNDADGDGLYNLATVTFFDWINIVTREPIWVTEGKAEMEADGYFIDYRGGNGVALVRDVNPIPIPGALPLFASAMMVFGWFYRRRKR